MIAKDKICLALYTRLSRSDGDLGKDGKCSEDIYTFSSAKSVYMHGEIIFNSCSLAYFKIYSFSLDVK